MRLRLTRQADHDIEAILRETVSMFGPQQTRHYGQLISKAFDLVANDPERPSSRERSDIRPGVRSFHVSLAANRRAAASHQIYYLAHRTGRHPGEVIVLRVLHERMEPSHRVLESLEKGS